VQGRQRRIVPIKTTDNTDFTDKIEGQMEGFD
jgi:hypothetical protein